MILALAKTIVFAADLLYNKNSKSYTVGTMRLFFRPVEPFYHTIGAMHLNSRVSGDSLVE
jgi:transposase